MIAAVGLSVVLAATVFAVADGALFRPLPYPHPQELFVLSPAFDDDTGVPDRSVRYVSPAEVSAWSAFVPAIPITLVSAAGIPLPDGTNVGAMAVDRRFAGVFGVRLLMGGWFEEASYNLPFQPTVSPLPIIISHAVWREKFGSDPSIIGRSYSSYTTAADPTWLTAPVFRIVGVLDQDGFVPPQPGANVSWVRRENRVDVLYPREAGVDRERSGTAYVRISPDRVAAAEALLQSAVVARRPTTSGRSGPYDRVTLKPLGELLTERQRPIYLLVFATAVSLALLVLLNTSGLAAARAQRRLAEFVLCRSLGARTTDLLWAALVEQGLLTGLGVVLGLAVAPWIVHIVGDQLPPGLTLIDAPRVDWRAVGFAAALSAAMAVAVAALTTWYTTRYAVLSSIVPMRHGPTRVQARLGRWLVAGQIAIAFALVLGGGMFVTSLRLVWNEDPGVRTHDAALMTLSLGELAFVDREIEVATLLRSIPGMRAAGAMDGSLFENQSRTTATFRDPEGTHAEPLPAVVRVGPGWFDAADIQLLQGRFPTDAELAGTGHVIVVSELLARRYWPDGSPLGRSLVADRQQYRIVGVVRDVRVAALDVPSMGMIIAPLKAARSRRTHAVNVFLALEDRRPPTVTEVADYLARVAPRVRIRKFQLIEDALADSIRPRRISAMTASTFAIGAVALVAIAVFGVVAQVAGWRRREMGVRLALGDVPTGIVARVMLEPVGAVTIGLVVGGVLAAIGARTAGSYLYGIEPYDFRVWTTTIVILLATAAVAAAIPAIGAGRVDPIAVLRED